MLSARIVYEEYDNYRTVGLPEKRAINTLRKKGVFLTLISQAVPEDDVLIQNCGVKIVHGCGSPKMAREAAEWFMGLLDPYQVHHHTERVISDGYEMIEQTRWTESTNRPVHGSWRDETRTRGMQRQDVMRPIQRTVRDAHYTSLSDQILLMAARLQSGMKPGDRIVNRNGKITEEHVPLLKERYAGWPRVLQEKRNAWLAEMRTSGWYITPTMQTEEAPLIGAEERRLELRGLGRIQVRTAKSNRLQDSRAIKPAKGQSKNGRNGN